MPRVAGADDAAAAQHRRPVAQRADLVELVADVEDAAALGGERAQRLEQLLDGLRRQHRRRLVHDQQLRVLQQAADDLDALALAHRQRVHVPVGIERQAVVSSRPSRMRVARSPVGGVVERERDVLGDGQRLEQREVLEHHADAESARARRVARW